MRVKDITLKNIKAFLEGNLRMFLINSYRNMLEHIFEQVKWREEQVQEKSPECITNGECKICKCSIPGLFYADKACKGGCYPKMMGKLDWAHFKNLESIKDETTRISNVSISVKGAENEVAENTV